MKKRSQHVVPSSDGGWAVRRSGADRASKVFEKKDEAVSHARDVARREHSELFIHRRDGMIQQKNSYGNDPNPPKDKR